MEKSSHVFGVNDFGPCFSIGFICDLLAVRGGVSSDSIAAAVTC